jgi:hypothetical protein
MAVPGDPAACGGWLYRAGVRGPGADTAAIWTTPATVTVGPNDNGKTVDRTVGNRLAGELKTGQAAAAIPTGVDSLARCRQGAEALQDHSESLRRGSASIGSGAPIAPSSIRRLASLAR